MSKFHPPCETPPFDLLSKTKQHQFVMCYEEHRLQEAIDDLKRRTSDQNLALIPDYEQRLDVLKALSFIDEESRVQLKGRVACEVRGKLI